MQFDDDEEIVLDIDDPQVPEQIRIHAARFDTPVRFAIFCGSDILLIAEDGELIDLCYLT